METVHMHTTTALIDLAKERLAARYSLENPVTDYRFSKVTRISFKTVSNWRTGRSVIGAEYVPQFSEWCGMAPEYVYACLEHERAKLPQIKGILARIASKYAA